MGEATQSYYAQVERAVAHSLQKVSAAAQMSPTPEALTTGRDGWHNITEGPVAARLPYAGFRLHGVHRIVSTLLVSFRWENGPEDTVDAVFVWLYSMQGMEHPVDIAETIITTNLLEELGREWWRHRRFYRLEDLALWSGSTGGRRHPAHAPDKT